MTRHRDWSGKGLNGEEITSPGVHVTRSLDDTDDEGDGDQPARRNTPVEVQAIRMAERVAAAALADTHAPHLTRTELAMLDYLSIEVAQRLAEIHSQQLANGPRVVSRVRELERQLADHVKRAEEWRGWLCGANDGNGQVGNLKRAMESLRADIGTPDERRKERSRVATLGWIGVKLAGAVVAIGGMLGYAAVNVKASYDAVIRTAARDEAWRHTTDQDIGRLFLLVGSTRGTTP